MEVTCGSERNTVRNLVSYVLSNTTQNTETNARKGQSGDLYVNKKAYRREVNHMMRKRDLRGAFLFMTPIQTMKNGLLGFKTVDGR